MNQYFALMILKYCVYVLFSEKDKQLYIGFTTNLEKRLENHHLEETKSTSSRRPLILIFADFYLHEENVMKKELYFKTSAERGDRV